MEFELPKINVSFEYDKEKGETVFVINGVEKRVKTEDIIKKLDEKQPRFIMHSDGSLEQIVEYCEDCISRQAVLDGIEELKKSPWATDKRGIGFEYLITEALEVVADLCIKQEPSVTPKPKTDVPDKIRAEIENDWQLKKYPSSPFACGLRRAIEIIDKYKAESEETE